MSELLEETGEIESALPLDPFGSRPQWASICGLGGHEPPPDPSYVFLTLDCRPAIGTVSAIVRFHDLKATSGMLVFEVRARSAVPGSEHARLQTVVVGVDELLQSNGIFTTSFESYRNTYYAIACSINDETDLVASHISISIDRRATPAQHGRDWEWSSARSTSAGESSGMQSALVGRSLTDLGEPRLESPMSQVGSPGQCREAAFAEAMVTLRRDNVASLENWSLAYVLQAINRFGGVQDSYRMLGYGADEAPLISHFAARNCEVVGMTHAADGAQRPDPGRELQQLWVPELCDEARFFANAHFTSGDIRRHVEPFRDQFDVIWSIGANRVMTPLEFEQFVVNGLAHARPGGLAVHVFDYVEGTGEDRGMSLTRQHIERIAVLALSHHNQVARLQFQHGGGLPDPGVRLPFGLVVLRGGLS